MLGNMVPSTEAMLSDKSTQLCIAATIHATVEHTIASRRSRVGVGMNRSARDAKSVKRFERSNGLDIALYKKNYLYLIIAVCEYSETVKS